ncbi:Uncharacterized conserved protein YeaO, DUF488 family [Paenibacillus algorifonticola]|uniref:Uncharacterized conserved protein YeaO, DUF488 family n=1 Tax=Paenibacillus algorifonticola TaxID=684063 RepID=A0A1I1ZUT5_9BACL|nr:DUF488 family protein [Paenibacillus algorifonticola]SFE35471.1 Uncharacterized conserved protein YeaO, DUF488 family [Paenibacillus algorifonticola]
MLPSGKLYTSNLNGLKKINFEAKKLMITRAEMAIEDVAMCQALAPSQELFQFSLDGRKEDADFAWWPKYEERFVAELQFDRKLEALRQVYRMLLEGSHVVLVCFCHDHRYCHRRLVGEFFEPYGVKAEELNPILIEQMKLF